MHESAIVRDLMTRVEEEAGGEPVRSLRLRVGALSGVTSAALAEGIRHYAHEAWGQVPRVETEESSDPTDPQALGVVLVAIGIGG